MREKLELPRMSLKERDRRWALTRKEMEARGLDCLVPVGLARGVGLLHRQCALSVADRRQCRIQCPGISAQRRADILCDDADLC
jgi:hypothetical protein